MIEFNLFPWRREQKRAQMKQLRVALFAAIGLSLGGVALSYCVLLKLIVDLKEHIRILQRQSRPAIHRQDSDFRAKVLFDQVMQYDTWQRQFFDLFAEKTQEKLCFKKIRVNERDQMVMSGIARSMEDLTTYLLNSQQKGLMKQVSITSFEQTKEASSIYFSLSAVLTYPRVTL